MNWYIGTMGFGYSDWIDVFYPSGMPSHKYLTYYSNIFNSVEIDSTFYGTPRIDTILRWKQMVPLNFKICVKVPRVITHELGLINVGGLMAEFLERISLLGEKLGVILFQFPPSFGVDQLPRLEDLWLTIPANFRIAIEVRNVSWFSNSMRFVQFLKVNNICWTATEYPGLPGVISVTSDFIYIRWIGQHGTFSHHNRERIDRIENMRKWWKKMKEKVNQNMEIYGFFNNDYAGFAPGSANKFKEIVGLPVEQYKPAQQGRLL